MRDDLVWRWLAPHDKPRFAVVLQWHEGHATVLEVQEDGSIKDGARPFMAKASELAFFGPPNRLAGVA